MKSFTKFWLTALLGSLFLGLNTSLLYDVATGATIATVAFFGILNLCYGLSFYGKFIGEK